MEKEQLEQLNKLLDQFRDNYQHDSMMYFVYIRGVIDKVNRILKNQYRVKKS